MNSTHLGGRPKGAKTTHRYRGVFKKCPCAKWTKCHHPWHMTFRSVYRFQLDKAADRLDVPRPMSSSEALRVRSKVIDQILDGTWDTPKEATAPVAETPLTLDDVCQRYETFFAQQTWRGEKRRAHRVPLLKQQLTLICRTRIPAAKDATVRFGDKPFADIITADIDAFCEAHRAYMAAQEQARLDRRAKVAAGDIEAKKIPVNPARPRARGGEIGLNKHLGVLRAMFNFAIRKSLYHHSNPFLLHGQSVVAFADAQARNRRLVGDEEVRLLAAMDSARWTHLRALTIAAIETGMRKGELLSLTWAGVTFDSEDRPRYIDLVAGNTKTNEPRRVYVTPRLADVLVARRSAPDGEEHPPEAYVFGNSVGEKVGSKFESVKTGWGSACKKAGIENLHFHDLRRTFGSRLLERGASLMTVSRLLGHKLLTTTNTYLKPSESLVEQEHRKLFPWPATRRQTMRSKAKATAAVS
jgi:integrase